MTDFFIRPAASDDDTAIDIILSTYFLDRDDLPYEDFFVAEANNKVIGCGVFEKIKIAGAADAAGAAGAAGDRGGPPDLNFDCSREIVFYEIHTIAVLPPYKNKGCGKMILERLMSEIENKMMPSVSKTVYTRTTAPAFFIRFGFSKADPALKKQLWEECAACGKYETCAQTLLYKEI